MLYQTEIRLGSLLYWLGMTVGFGLLVANFVTDAAPFGRAGMAVIIITCSHSMRLALIAHSRAVRETAEEEGRQRERERSRLTAVPSVN